MREARHVFLQSGYRADLTLRASRYKTVLILEICIGIVILLTVLERSGFSQDAGNCLGSRSKPAKTVTSLLIIPSVLAKVILFLSHRVGSVKKAESPLFFLVFGQYPGLEES